MLKLKLFILMVLQLFIWGAWLPVIFGYLGNPPLSFSETQQSWVLNAFAIGSFAAMFFSTPFADRMFPAEKFLAASHLIGGGSILALTWVSDFNTFFLLMLVHCLAYVPTLSIANGLAFSHLTDAKGEFGPVRMGGTVGWILASWPLFFILQGVPKENEMAAKANVFLIAGVAEIALAFFCLSLPHTPPKKGDGTQPFLLFLESFKLLKHPFIAVLFIVTFIDAAVHQCFFIWTDTFLVKRVEIDAKWIMPIMSIGQVAEIGTMAVLGFFLKNLGWKLTMTFGILGHFVRFGVFALMPDNAPLVIAINILHGVCYAFFFATVYIFVDEFFPKSMRSTAQGMFNFLIFGMGPFVGNFVWPMTKQLAPLSDNGDILDYRNIFLAPAGTALAAAAILFIFFRVPDRYGHELPADRKEGEGDEVFGKAV
jgi:nucleoside transporter